MNKIKKLHLHSMVVHVPCITIPLTAIFHHLFDYSEKHLYWTMSNFLLAISLITIIISIVSGVIERSHKHANWFPSFKKKFGLSIFLFISLLSVSGNIFSGAEYNCSTFNYISIGFIQPILVIWAMIIGIISSQGRFGGRVSYKKDVENTSDFDIKEVTVNKIKEMEND